MISEQRRFQRFAITENAIATDAGGRALGRVIVAGGGGMSIALSDPSSHIVPGQRLSVTVVEPESGIRHTIHVVVRYREKDVVGVEFVTGKNSTPGARRANANP